MIASSDGRGNDERRNPTDLRREQWHWERLAANDPMWVICTESGKEGQWNSQEFYETGRADVQHALRALRELNLDPARGRALDFGCGLGRLTQALAEYFDTVDGVDISATMVGQARTANKYEDRVHYHVNAVPHLGLFEDGRFDFVYSRITLQHIPRPLMRRYVTEFIRVLRPGGLAMFQLLTHAYPWGVRLRHRIRDRFPEGYRRLRDLVSRRARWEMNTMSEVEARETVTNNEGRVEAVIEDEARDPVFASRWFIVTKTMA